MHVHTTPHGGLTHSPPAAAAGQPLSVVDKMSCAALAGTASSLIGTPSELIIIKQQQSGHSLLQESRLFLEAHGLRPLWRGLGSCAARETIYAGGYLGLAPIVKDAVDRHPAFQEVPAVARVIMSGGLWHTRSHEQQYTCRFLFTFVRTRSSRNASSCCFNQKSE